ncbi:MAG: zinc ribbon domain-containing protein [Chloroflexales bacterium]|nr:zinc ribbon domain-containing protein [Chloroflexales bacterium]
MVMVSQRCPACGDTCPPGAVFCISCGAALQRPATATTRLLRPQRVAAILRWPTPRLPHLPSSLGQRLIVAGVAAFGLALLTLLILVAYVGSYRPGLSPLGWLLVFAGAAQLVREARRGAPFTGMRHAVLCAAVPFGMVTRAPITTTVFFGGAFVLLAVVQFLVALLPRRRWRP